MCLPVMKEENSDSVAAGLVIRSNPDSGTKADKTMEIHLVVSKGPAVVEVEVPSLYGMKRRTQDLCCRRRS